MTDRRTAILEATVSEIAKDGIRGLRLGEVAKSAGVAMSLIYYHFQTREGLIDAVLQQANLLVKRNLSVISRIPMSGRHRVELLLLSELDYADPEVRQASMVWSEVVSAASFNTALSKLVVDATQGWIDIIADVIAAGIEDASLTSDIDPVRSAQRLTALVSGLVYRWQSGVHSVDEIRALLSESIACELGPKAF